MPDNRKYADRREYLKNAVSKQRKFVRLRAIEYKGGKCAKCGYDKCTDALDFHHENGSKNLEYLKMVYPEAGRELIGKSKNAY